MQIDLQVGQLTLGIMSFFLGLMAGFLSGLLGVGGGWLLTPGLNLLGIPMPIAVGTSLTQMIGGSFAGCLRHARRGNIVYAMSLLLGLPLLLGVFLGKSLMVYWHEIGISDELPRIIFIVTLTFMGLFMLHKNRNHLSKRSHPERKKLGIWKAMGLVTVAVPIGILSGVLGMGGGFFMVPILCYVVGLTATQASASSLLAILICSSAGSVAYFNAGMVDINLALIVMSGSVLGAFLGAGLTHRVDGARLKGLFSYLVLLAAMAMTLRHFGFGLAAFILLFGSALVMTLIALGSLINRTDASEKSS